MFRNLLLIFIIIITNYAILSNSNDASYIGKIADSITKMFFDNVGSPELFADSDSSDNKFNYLHESKFGSSLLLEKCIKFHESEIVSVDMRGFIGRWDRHLMSVPMPFEYVYGMAKMDDKEQAVHFEYFPMGYYSLKYARNNTKMIRAYFVVNDYLGIKLTDDESIIGFDQNSYFLKYSCIEMMGRVTTALHLQLRPELTAQLNTNPELFSEILDSIPEKSLNKISHLITKLNHQIDKRFENFGQTYAKTLTQRLEKYRRDNHLSDKSDDQMFQYLDHNCAQFKDRELLSTDLSTISSSNWTLIQTDSKEMDFNRMTIKRLLGNTFTLSLLKGNTHLAYSDHYYDEKRNVFWAFTEGRRSLEVPIYSDAEHRLIYCCEEKQIDEKLGIHEKWRFFSNENNTDSVQNKNQSFDSILSQLSSKLDPATFEKIANLLKDISKPKEVPIHEDL